MRAATSAPEHPAESESAAVRANRAPDEEGGIRAGADDESTGAARAVPAPSLRERRQRRTREELVDAVLAVIATCGLADTTIERVSAASGVSRGTVYAYFPGGRDELFRAAYARLGSQLVERTRTAVSAAGDWKGRLVAHARAMFDLAGDANIGHFYNVSGPTLISEGAERGIGSGASMLMISETLEHAQASGEVAPDIDAEAVADLLVGALREAAVGVAAGVREPERAFRAFASLVEGLAAR